MGVYTYRITEKIVSAMDGRKVNVTEFMSRAPTWRDDTTGFDRKVSTAHQRAKRLAERDQLYDLYAESDYHGSTVYIGNHVCYDDCRDYVVARDEHGAELTVYNPRKVYKPKVPPTEFRSEPEQYEELVAELTVTSFADLMD